MSRFWNVMTVGPTIPSMYLDKRIENDKDYGMNLFKPNVDACMSWLGGKPKDSVLYVSFGSLASLGIEQTTELACALKSSNVYFLWVVRETEMAKLPYNFIEETSEVWWWHGALNWRCCRMRQLVAFSPTVALIRL